MHAFIFAEKQCMKPIFHLFFLGLLSSIFSSCGTPATTSDSSDKSAVSSRLISKHWLVNTLQAQGEDETNLFKSYILYFYEDYTMKLTNNTTTYEGVWNITSVENEEEEELVFVEIDLDAPPVGEFDLLNGNWFVDQITTSSVTLEITSANLTEKWLRLTN